MTQDNFFLTNLELRISTDTGEIGSGLSHASMEGMFLLQVIELAAAGEPRGAVTVIHDAGDHSGRYKPIASELAQAGWAVALPDMRGHGESEGDRGHSGGIQEWLRDINEIQNHLAYRMPDAPKILIGQGLGALQALAFTLENPGIVNLLVLLGLPHEPAYELPQAATGLMKMFKKVGHRSPGSLGYGPSEITSDAGQQQAWRDDSRTHEIISKRAGEQVIEAARTYLGRVGECGIPVLVMHGADDSVAQVGPSRALASDKVDFQEFAGLRHDLLHESRSAEVQTALLAWLDQKLPR